jgi:two-component system, response regulator YesN
MWNLLIVEDETIVRVGLRYMVDWESHGFYWKAEASNGEEALTILEVEDIHVVMTDIRMPGIDGIELAKRIKMKNPAIPIIFLSSYDNFSYAKEAIKIGAVDYLHKATMDEAEVAEVLTKVASLLRDATVEGHRLSEEERNEYFLSLLDKYTFPAQPYLSELQSQKFEAGYWMTVFRKRDDAVAESAESNKLRFTSIQYLISEYVSKGRGGIVFHRNYREIIWIAPVTDITGTVAAEERVKYLEGLKQKVFELLSVTLLYSTSSIYSDIGQLPEAYLEVLLQLPVNEQSDNFIVRKAKEYVDRHLLEDVTLTKVSLEVHVSSGHLSRVFLKEVGENFSDYVIRNKMEYAQRLLRETNKKIYEIASEIGYTNSHYFSKLFKERTGLSPLEYRNQ